MCLPEFNLNSNDHLSILFFGGKLKVKVHEPIKNVDGTFAVIKTGVNKGKFKVKLVEKEINIDGMSLNPLNSWKTKKEGFYQTNKAVLQIIAQENESNE